jgi:hypothetical protein
VELLEHLSTAHDDKTLGTFFHDLLAEVKADHDRLHDIMKALGIDESSMRNAGAWVAEKFGRGKLGFGGGETSGLPLLQALETLAIGITRHSSSGGHSRRLSKRRLFSRKQTSIPGATGSETNRTGGSETARRRDGNFSRDVTSRRK